MKTNQNDPKLILSCNKFGMVTQLFLDTASILENINLPFGLHSIVSPLSIKELGDFWINIQEKSIQEDTLITIHQSDKEITYIFSGYLLKNTILLCGNTALNSSNKTLEEIMLINNEQANHIRLAEKKATKLLFEKEKREINEDFLNDFSNINNELINSQRELIQKNKKIELLNQELNAVNENMSMFTYSISHDLREPLRMVNSFLSLLDRRYGENLEEKGQTYLKMAKDGASKLNSMLTDLLEYHRSSNLSIEERVDLNKVVSAVQEIIKKEIEEKQAHITCEKLPTVKGSFVGYQQVFQNLLSNAIKFIPQGKNPIISICINQSQENYTISVSDNGVGIPENQKQDVFNLFKRLNPSQFEGTGMGLAMVRKNIERMRGKIWLESKLNEGTTFYFTIPKH